MLKRFIKNKKGFTLIELIVVIAIVAVLAAVGIPAIAGQVAKSKQAELEQNAKLIALQGGIMFATGEANGLPASDMEATDTGFTDDDIIKAVNLDAGMFSSPPVITRSGVDETSSLTTDTSKMITWTITSVELKKGSVTAKWTRV